MGLFVSTVSSDVQIPELGIVITHPTVDRDLLAQFSSDELSRAASLTTAITSGSLIWKKTSGGPTELAANYDADWSEAEELNTGSGLMDDRLVKFSDLPPGIGFGSPVSIGTSNQDGVSTLTARADHVHNHGAQTEPTHHAVATTLANGFMSSIDKTKIDGIKYKSGNVAAGSFAGNPKKYTVTFTTPFASTNYAINITGADSRSWSWESKTVSGFIINSNANTALTGEVSWQAQLNGEVG